MLHLHHRSAPHAVFSVHMNAADDSLAQGG
jgi:hypothetical protein